MHEYLEKLLGYTRVVGAFIISGMCYLCFPDKAYSTAAIAVGVAMLLDIFTKYLALSYQSGGYKKAVKNKVIFSTTLWEKTRIKIISYLVVGILTGLAYRVTLLKDLGIFFGTVVYAVIFLREAQSNIENLIDAGAELGWLAKWVENKKSKILDDEEEKY